MIKLQELTPDVYYQKSRDFQFIGRLYELILNYSKTNSELINTLPINESSDTKLIDLMTMTLGFKSKHNYNLKQLTALCSAFTYILRNKGSLEAIQTACNVLFHAEGIQKETDVTVDTEKSILKITVPEEISDMNLLKDLFNYIIPAGMRVETVKVATYKQPASTELVVHSDVKWWTPTDTETSTVVANRVDDNIKRPVRKQSGFIVNTTVIKPESK